MRLHFQTDVVPRRMARKLQRCAQANGISLRLTFAQNQIARMFGYQSYNELWAVLNEGAGSDRIALSANDYHRAAVVRLAADNGWTIELAERLCEPVRTMLEWAVDPGAAGSKVSEQPALVVKLKGRSRNRGSFQPQVRVFDLSGREGGTGCETCSE